MGKRWRNWESITGPNWIQWSLVYRTLLAGPLRSCLIISHKPDYGSGSVYHNNNGDEKQKSYEEAVQNSNGKINRKHLRQFKCNEYIPLLDPFVLEDKQETPVWLLLPFPGLHTIILGPVNDLIDSLVNDTDNLVQYDKNPVDGYMKIVNITRSPYFAMKLEGNLSKVKI